MATERRRMQLRRSQPGRKRQTPTGQTPARAPIPTVLLIVLPFLVLAVGACGGGEDGAEPTDGGDTGPPTADEIRDGASASASAPAPSDSSGSPTPASDGTGSSTSGSSPSSSGTSPSIPPPSAQGAASASSDSGGPPYAVQLGAFERESNGQRLQQSLEDAGFPVWTGETGNSGPALLRVRVGATTTVADARRLVDAIRDRLPDAPDSVWIAPLGTEGGAPEEMMTATRAILDDG